MREKRRRRDERDAQQMRAKSRRRHVAYLQQQGILEDSLHWFQEIGTEGKTMI